MSAGRPGVPHRTHQDGVMDEMTSANGMESPPGPREGSAKRLDLAVADSPVPRALLVRDPPRPTPVVIETLHSGPISAMTAEGGAAATENEEEEEGGEGLGPVAALHSILALGRGLGAADRGRVAVGAGQASWNEASSLLRQASPARTAKSERPAPCVAPRAVVPVPAAASMPKAARASTTAGPRTTGGINTEASVPASSPSPRAGSSAAEELGALDRAEAAGQLARSRQATQRALRRAEAAEALVQSMRKELEAAHREVEEAHAARFRVERELVVLRARLRAAPNRAQEATVRDEKSKGGRERRSKDAGETEEEEEEDGGENEGDEGEGDGFRLLALRTGPPLATPIMVVEDEVRDGDAGGSGSVSYVAGGARLGASAVRASAGPVRDSASRPPSVSAPSPATSSSISALPATASSSSSSSSSTASSIRAMIERIPASMRTHVPVRGITFDHEDGDGSRATSATSAVTDDRERRTRGVPLEGSAYARAMMAEFERASLAAEPVVPSSSASPSTGMSGSVSSSSSSSSSSRRDRTESPRSLDRTALASVVGDEWADVAALLVDPSVRPTRSKTTSARTTVPAASSPSSSSSSSLSSSSLSSSSLASRFAATTGAARPRPDPLQELWERSRTDRVRRPQGQAWLATMGEDGLIHELPATTGSPAGSIAAPAVDATEPPSLASVLLGRQHAGGVVAPRSVLDAASPPTRRSATGPVSFEPASDGTLRVRGPLPSHTLSLVESLLASTPESSALSARPSSSSDKPVSGMERPD